LNPSVVFVVDRYCRPEENFFVKQNTPPTSRREFIKQTSTFAAASALAGVALPHVHAAENNTIQVALSVAADAAAAPRRMP